MSGALHPFPLRIALSLASQGRDDVEDLIVVVDDANVAPRDVPLAAVHSGDDLLEVLHGGAPECPLALPVSPDRTQCNGVQCSAVTAKER